MLESSEEAFEGFGVLRSLKEVPIVYSADRGRAEIIFNTRLKLVSA